MVSHEELTIEKEHPSLLKVQDSAISMKSSRTALYRQQKVVKMLKSE